MSLPHRIAAVAALLAFGADFAAAQPAAPSAARPASVAAPSYRSAFDGYRPFADQPVEPWRAVNDRVREIGGWKAYAREAQQPDGAAAAKPAAAPASPPAGHKH